MVKLLFYKLTLVTCANMALAKAPIGICFLVRVEYILRVKNLFCLTEKLKDLIAKDSRQPRAAHHAVIVFACKGAAIL